MKTVLLIAYFFPPMGGSGVHRTAKFVKHLGAFGWSSAVLTRDDAGARIRDDSLSADIPSGTPVYRTRPYDLTSGPGPLGLLGKFISRRLLVPDGEWLWARTSVSEAVQIIQRHAVDVVYTTSYPYSAHLMGRDIKRRLGNVRWVADFRDEWTNNPYLLDAPHPRPRMAVERSMERAVLKEADHLITNTQVMLQNFLASNPGLGLESRFTVINNGFDSEDFEGLTRPDTPNRRFLLVHTGALYGRRKPDVLFQALGSLIASGKLPKDGIRVELIGNYQERELLPAISRYGLDGAVHPFPYMEHRRCLERLAAADVLVLLEGAGKGGRAFSTGKVFEYMNLGKMILAIVPEGGAAGELVQLTKTGTVVDCEDARALESVLLGMYQGWKDGSLATNPDWEEIRKYERRELARKLAGVFDEVTQIPLDARG